MNTVTDDDVLATLKKYLSAPEARDAIAFAATLADAERLLEPFLGGRGGVRERVQHLREFLENNAGAPPAAIIGA